VLQAYALKTKLKNMGYDAVVLNYRNPYIAKVYRKVLHIDFWKRDILPSRWGKVLKEVRDVFYGLPEWKRQWQVFETFITDRLLEGDSRVLKSEDVEQSDCDLFILGSDQIWARELTHGMDPVYFGQFAPERVKISYAASVPDGTIPEAEKPYFKEYLKSISSISVREEKLAESLRTLTGRNVETVIDPTLLLERADYEPLLTKNPRKTEDYILAYYVVESEVLQRCAKAASRLLNCELLEIHYKKTPTIKGENMILDAGPGEFLSCIRDAKLVMTNSFHGTVFSILFRKKFYSVYQQNGRIENLLEFLDLTDRHICREEEIRVEQEIDYTQSESRLAEYRRKSIGFLERAIESMV
jgi:hypothetical protein